MEGFDPEPRAKPITLRLIMENSLTKEELVAYNALDTEEAMASASKLKTMHLEWQNIAEISGLEMFELVDVLYLQHNRIGRIEGLECMPKLQFLALQSNRITVIQNLESLKELEFLDLSKNQIDDLDEDQIPATVNMLNLSGNPCTLIPDYQVRLHARLPDLFRLDGKNLEELPSDIAAAGVAAAVAAAESVDLLATEKGLGRFQRKGEMRSNANASIREQIEAYSVEALAEMDGVEDATARSKRVEDATARSKARRDGLNASGRLGNRLSTPMHGTGKTLT